MNKLLPRFALVISLFSFFAFFSTSQVNAFEIRQGDRVVLSPTDSIDGSLFVAGKTLIIDTRIDGDLYCAGQNVTINGAVTGDVLCTAQNLTINGRVGGDVRSAAQLITLNSLVDRNVNLFAQDIILGKEAVVTGELYTAGQSVTIDGLVMKTWAGGAENVYLNGRVVGSATLAADNLSLADDATVSGGITRVETDKKIKKDKDLWKGPATATNGFKFMGKFMGTLMGLVYGLLIVYLFPKWLKRTASIALDKPGKSTLWGFAVWLIAPVLVVLSFITIIGIPLGLLGILMLFFISFTTWTVAGAAVGSRIMSKKTQFVWAWLAGYLLISVTSWLPIIGWLISLAVILIGTGAIKYSFLHNKKK